MKPPAVAALIAVVALSAFTWCTTTPEAPPEYRQGVYRPTPPALRPGHGAPLVGQPGVTVAPLPQPQPGRLLPQTPETRKQPGVWAADVPDDAPATPILDGVAIPYPPEALAEREAYPTWNCAKMMTVGVKPYDPKNERLKWPEQQRRCLVARMYQNCVEAVLTHYGHLASAGSLRDPGLKRKLETTKEVSDRFAADECKNVKETTAMFWMAKGAADLLSLRLAAHSPDGVLR